jgi:hypothetical protein
MKCNSHQIRIDVPVNVFGFFIHVSYIPAAGDPGRQIGHGNLLKVENARPSHSADVRRRSGYQQQVRHSCLLNLHVLVRTASGTRITPVSAVGQSGPPFAVASALHAAARGRTPAGFLAGAPVERAKYSLPGSNWWAESQDCVAGLID